MIGATIQLVVINVPIAGRGSKRELYLASPQGPGAPSELVALGGCMYNKPGTRGCTNDLPVSGLLVMRTRARELVVGDHSLLRLSGYSSCTLWRKADVTILIPRSPGW